MLSYAFPVSLWFVTVWPATSAQISTAGCHASIEAQCRSLRSEEALRCRNEADAQSDIADAEAFIAAGIATRTLYRAADTVLEDKSNDEAFARFEKNHFELHAREAGKTSFKKKISSKFKIESNRYLMLYKLFKSSSGVSQVGIDENGYLILNYPTVIEYTKQGSFISYYAIIEQFHF